MGDAELVDDQPRALYEAAIELLEADDVSHLLSAAVRRAKQLLETDIAYVMLLDREANVLRLESSVGHRTPTFTTIVRPAGAGTVAEGKPIQSADFLNDSHLDHHPATDDVIRREGMRNVLAVPLKSAGQMLGALYVGNRYVRQFSAAEVELLVRLARLIAAALAHAHALAEARSELAQVNRLAEEADRERTLLHQVQDIRRSVALAMRDRQGISALCVASAEALGVPIFVMDWRPSIVAAHAPLGLETKRNYAALLQRRDGREALAACSESHRPVRLGANWWIAPIESSNRLFGYLGAGVVGGPSGQAVAELVLEWLADMAAVELAREGDMQSHLHNDFIYELLSERSPDYTVLEARGPHVWEHFAAPHRPVAMNIGAEAEGWLSRLEAARRLVAAARPHDFSAVYGNRLVVLVSPATRAAVSAAVSEIRDLLERNRMHVAAAVGAECRNLHETRASLLATLRLQELLDPREVLWTEGLEALSALFDPAQKDRLEAFAVSALAALESRPTLMDALEAYYECGGNKLAAARRLDVHVNTIRQRIERVEQLVGASVDDSTRAVPLRLALLVRRVGRRHAANSAGQSAHFSDPNM